ncbi:flagellar assembly peptidoglycan hydrolase FlgJ [Solimonas terrae]|uniref:Peptidoglycan hydrolase FlgJ n=1 Tax=Solimonas terrae TaxID=1396819 RepID=A0A6M2BQB8_9GAMM|nr:flagellar assembly peptidoglycan hydrolase FlgJ [Solimonas terrae]NGY04411.1 flagellar assembly peptidoglycan hydrolase FlgJ [Solimonas terrae]
MSTRPTDAITDFSQFQGMRRGARSGDEATIRKAAQQFEALLTQQLFKNMRAGSLGDDVMGGGQTGFYQDLFDQQMSVHLSSGKGLGLADMLVRQLRGSSAAQPGDSAATTLEAAAASGSHHAFALQSQANDVSGASATAGSAGKTPEAFVQAILPHAERAARELGVPARVLVAQAALETGWGKHAIKDADGKSSFNFFGIKSDRRWQGDAVSTTTTEFVDGEEQRQQADFRSYDSAGEAFDNYVDFLKSNPRYAQALNHGGSASHFVQGLQNAGYATDPAYADKIMKIANGPTMQLALASGRRSYAV